MKPGTPLLRSTRLLDQVSERIGYTHYSLKAKKAYVYWVRFFIRWSPRSNSKCNTYSVENLLHVQDLHPSEP